MTIYDYFNLKFGTWPSDESLMRLGLTTTCGRDCMAAIDAGAALVAHVRKAWGRVTEREEEIKRQVEEICLVFWKG